MSVLIVDRNRSSAQRAMEMLQDEGFDVVLAASFAEARDALCSIPFGGLLIDVQESPADALRLIREVRQRDRDLPIIASSATIIPYEQAALEAGCTAFIEKPFVGSCIALIAALWLRNPVAA